MFRLEAPCKAAILHFCCFIADLIMPFPPILSSVDTGPREQEIAP
jgi:hypothetical protein